MASESFGSATNYSTVLKHELFHEKTLKSLHIIRIVEHKSERRRDIEHSTSKKSKQYIKSACRSCLVSHVCKPVPLYKQKHSVSSPSLREAFASTKKMSGQMCTPTVDSEPCCHSFFLFSLRAFRLDESPVYYRERVVVGPTSE